MKKLIIVGLGLLLSGITQAAVPAPGTLAQKIQRQIASARLHSKNIPNLGLSEKQLAAYRQTMFNRFLHYVTYNSASSYTEEITEGQKEIARALHQEIQKMGYPEAQLTDHYYIFVRIPSNLPEGQTAPVLGFSGHFDVTPDVATTNVHARVIERYKGGKVIIGKNPQGEEQVLDPDSERDAYLKQMIGQKIVTSDGTTNLGADNRAGLSILMTLLQVLVDHPEKQHGEIQVVIAPNEETGGAADYIAQVPYRPEIAFDFDGSVNGELMTDNFNALQILCTVQGHEGHQSNADGPYINHGLAASDLVKQVYEDPSIPRRFASNSIVNPDAKNNRWLRLPSESRGREGYLDVFIQRPANDKTVVDFRARSFSQADLDEIENFIREIVASLSKKYKEANKEVLFSIETRTTYNNVGETAHPASLEVSRRAFEAAGVKMNPTSVRAGTTGAIFTAATKNEPEKIVGSYMLFTGQNNMHSYSEWLSEKDMYESFLVGLNLIDQVVILGDKK